MRRFVWTFFILLFAAFVSAGEPQSLTNVPSRVQTPKPLTEGGVVLTFDDRNFQDWIQALPLLDEFAVQATFFISGKIDGPAL
ncbi:polysaccharide deacetylase family protein, partial [Rhodopirellula baltica]|uniref:polysaccharide deacetylase family protein n=1 Tax=Rhodopirellula baltica TaxID=265606 RepID=UPI0011D2078B